MVKFEALFCSKKMSKCYLFLIIYKLKRDSSDADMGPGYSLEDYKDNKPKRINV